MKHWSFSIWLCQIWISFSAGSPAGLIFYMYIMHMDIWQVSVRYIPSFLTKWWLGGFFGLKATCFFLPGASPLGFELVPFASVSQFSGCCLSCCSASECRSGCVTQGPLESFQHDFQNKNKGRESQHMGVLSKLPLKQILTFAHLLWSLVLGSKMDSSPLWWFEWDFGRLQLGEPRDEAKRIEHRPSSVPLNMD